jgi:uncharacterized protein
LSLYCDSSAATKLHVVEDASDEVLKLVERSGSVAISVIGRAEISSAVSRSVRTGVIDRDQGRQALRSLDERWVRYTRVPVTEELVAQAAQYSWAFDIRGFDAVHLAAGMVLRRLVGEQVTFACFDRRLWLAARDLGLDAWPPGLASG